MYLWGRIILQRIKNGAKRTHGVHLAQDSGQWEARVKAVISFGLNKIRDFLDYLNN
jgi:hypothetical protein